MTLGLKIIQILEWYLMIVDNDQTSEGSENVVDCNAESLKCDTECKTQQLSACDDDEHWE